MLLRDGAWYVCYLRVSVPAFALNLRYAYGWGSRLMCGREMNATDARPSTYGTSTYRSTQRRSERLRVLQHSPRGTAHEKRAAEHYELRVEFRGTRYTAHSHQRRPTRSIALSDVFFYQIMHVDPT